ncbi:MAG TPA: phosphopentomutase [Bacteroidota bacterium]|nr:phosphopentomutase [Bacteroidota bacterium]
MVLPGKIVFIVLDSLGIGEAPDAGKYGDVGANTLGNTAIAVGGLHLSTLKSLGIGNIAPLLGVSPEEHPIGCFGKMQEVSKGKDSTTGHWELAGIIVEKDFPYYPKGFPPQVIDRFLAATGVRGVLGNRPASGTQIIAELGDEHARTGFPIVYTSGDSVFQIAAHEEVIPLQELYRICQLARDVVMTGEHSVGRVIARPFIGASGKYQRTPNRRDFSLQPPGTTMLDLLQRRGIPTVAIGKIDDLFAGKGLSEKIHTKSNEEGIEEIIRRAKSLDRGLIMTNLVDFDMLYGHRQDAKGMAAALEYFDRQLPRILEALRGNDLLLITADHGNDPTDASTDHSREYVPLLVHSPDGRKGVNLGVRKTFADAGKTVVDYFGADEEVIGGSSFLRLVARA